MYRSRRLFLTLLVVFTISGRFSVCSSSYSSEEDDPEAFAIDDVSSMSLSSGNGGARTQYTDYYDSKFWSLFCLKTRLAKPAPAPAPASADSAEIFNVDDYAAKGDGGDDSQAFKEAWKGACSSNNGVLLVPKDRTYHLKPITFSGPCTSDLILRIDGTIKASPHISDYKKDRRHWVVFQNIEDFTVEGGGTINGNGRKWWLNSCKVNKTLPCKEAPTAVTFYECNNLRVDGLNFRNSQQMHLSFQRCNNVKASNLWIYAPEHSPNTDGIHITATQFITIQNCLIMTGDDCISIVSGSKNVRIKDISCGPGHGISIGSLGAGKSEAEVSNVVVDRAKLSGTTNGVRIKTWQGGQGYAQNIVFQNIMMNNVTNPIIIDQNYCDRKEPCPKQAKAVEVSNVLYKNIKGTSASETAVKFDCSNTFPCQGVLLQDVNLVHNGKGDESAEASCNNVRLRNKGRVSPQCARG